MRRFKFDFDKGLEAILYITPKVKYQTFHTVSKILYFADLDHLEKYGRFITGDHYIAMEYGPVPSNINDIMKAARGEERFARQVEAIKSAFAVPGRYTIKTLRDSRTSVFSISDLECINLSLKKHGHKTFGQLADESHDAAWHATAEGSEMPLVEVAKMLPDSDQLIKHLEISKEQAA